MPSGQRIRYQVLRIAIPRKGRALPLLQLAYDRDRLPPQRSQNQLEQDALLAVVEALPAGVRPLILADRGFCRAGFLTWLEYQNLDYASCACARERASRMPIRSVGSSQRRG